MEIRQSIRLGRRRFELAWDGNDRFGIPVRSGTYFYRLEAPSWSETQEMTLLR